MSYLTGIQWWWSQVSRTQIETFLPVRKDVLLLEVRTSSTTPGDETSTSVHKLRKGEQILYFLNPFIPLLYHIYFCYLYTNLLISFHLTLLLIHYPSYPYVIIHVPFPFICNLYPFILFRLSISLLYLSFYSYLFIPSAFSPIPLFLSLYPSE